ncbi:DNA polymerase III subunit beta [Paraburkholderia bryophila]|uniref:DNA polymerase III subunit beta n=1 Tax=Paraburkholderia bryophila TaxID=420952 RepID=UPI0038BB2868
MEKLSFQVEKSDFLSVLEDVSNVVERRTTLPILSNILLTASDDKIDILGSDLELQITSSIVPKDSQQRGSVAVAAHKLLSIVRLMPEGVISMLTDGGGKIRVSGGTGSVSLRTLPAEDFPRRELSVKQDVFFCLEQARLLEMLTRVHFAMAREDIRYMLNGAYFRIDGQKLEIAACDGHRLATCTVPAEISCDQILEFILPKKTVHQLLRLLSATEEIIDIQITSEKSVTFSIAKTDLTSNFVNGRYPDYRRAIPPETKMEATVSRGQLLSALQRVQLLNTSTWSGARLKIRQGMIEISVTNSLEEHAHEQIEATYACDDIEMSFNTAYLIDSLSHLKTEFVKLNFNPDHRALLVKVPENPSNLDAVNVIMGLRD